MVVEWGQIFTVELRPLDDQIYQNIAEDVSSQSDTGRPAKQGGLDIGTLAPSTAGYEFGSLRGR